ncbi:uncharacterized protein LOC128736859 [Sabethes cyaneus]|uniref:uncharacterized protein LOC128736859 n=1 Tax=Sabethes cyaneus TaxID=53552 RepID=UPI00237EE5BE|nr:uncharacterized protein LOC128736859 [Sabethes cyaneus]
MESIQDDGDIDKDDNNEEAYAEEHLLDPDELEDENTEYDALNLGTEISEEGDCLDHSCEKSCTSDEDKATTLFSVSLVVSLRDFKGQTSGEELETWVIRANSVDEFLHSVWEKAKKHLIRHIVAVCDDEGSVTYTWSTKKAIDETDLVHFALFYDKQNRRTMTVDKITTKILQNWRTKSSVELLLHKYSLTVNSKAVWKKVEKTLIDTVPKNRGGAATTEHVQELAKELRLMHGHLWNGHEIAWNIWANTILTAPAYQHESLKNDATPPASCLDLFSFSEGEHIRRIRREYRVAHNINDGYHADVQKIMDAFTAVKNMHQEQTRQISVMERLLENLMLRSQLGESFISSAESALNVKESDFSGTISSKVQDAEDIDHTI